MDEGHISQALPRRQGRSDNAEWADIADPVERRKRQNRAHQRAWRRRKALQAAERLVGQHVEGVGPDGSSSAGPYGLLIPRQPVPSLAALREHAHALGWSITSLKDRGGPAIPAEEHTTTPTEAPSSNKLIPPLIPYIRHEKDIASFKGIVFPPPLDHRLITLIQFNVLRGTMTNMAIMSAATLMPVECRAVYRLLCLPLPSGPVPDALRPTILQQTMPHPGWISAMPDPGLRDNLIRHCGTYDEDDLCDDLAGGLYDGFDDVERRGVILWGEPFRVDGWEVSEGFARKWKFLLKGCVDLMESTNRWRAKRGEDPLIVEI